VGAHEQNATLDAVCNANGLWQWELRREGQRYRSHREYLTERAALAAGRKTVRKVAALLRS